MNEIDHHNACEAAAMGEHFNGCMTAIMEAEGVDTLARLARRAYKDTESGVCVSFLLDDGRTIGESDDEARDPATVGRVCAVGVSCIIEGSGAEVPPLWVEFKDCDDYTAAAAAYAEAVEQVDARAAALWGEINAEDAE